MRAIRHLRWQVLIALLGMLLVSGVLAGQTRETTTLLPTATPAPARGGIYTEALLGAPQRLNPLLDYANPVDRDIDRLIFSGLTRFDTLGRPSPDLANWVIAEDAKHYTFILKPGAQWHDGQPVTTADVAFTVGLLQDPTFPAAPELRKLWQAVEVTVGNAQVITFTLPEPFAPFLDYTTFGLLPAHVLQDHPARSLADDPFNLRPIGTGPFQLTQLTIEDNTLVGVELAAFERAINPLPLLTAVHFRFYPDSATALAAYERGEVNGISRIDDATLPTALRHPNLGLYTTQLPEYNLIYLNLTDPNKAFFQEKRVRQALWRSINRQAIINDVLQGQAVPADSPVPTGSWAHNPNLPEVAYDPETAVKLLEAAGWVLPTDALPGTENYVRQKNGQPLSFTLLVPNTPTQVAIAEAARKTWFRIGVRVQVLPVDPATLRDQYLTPRPRAFDAVLVTLSFVGTPDPDLYPFWHETQIESGQNYGGFNDPLMSQYLEQARIAPEMATRARLYYNFQSRFTDQTPALLLFYPVYTYAVDTTVSGVSLGPLIEPSDRLNTLPRWVMAQAQHAEGLPPVAPSATPPP